MRLQCAIYFRPDVARSESLAKNDSSSPKKGGRLGHCAQWRSIGMCRNGWECPNQHDGLPALSVGELSAPSPAPVPALLGPVQVLRRCMRGGGRVAHSPCLGTRACLQVQELLPNPLAAAEHEPLVAPTRQDSASVVVNVVGVTVSKCSDQ